MSAADHAAEYVHGLRLVSATLGALEDLTVDHDGQVVRVSWSRGYRETLSFERFVQAIQTYAAKMGHAVPF
jgi:hypothetical protein